MASERYNVTLIGLGTIGISFAALHLSYGCGIVKVFDPRPDIQEFIQATLPGYLSGPNKLGLDVLQRQGRLVICNSLKEACANANIIQEQGPEKLDFKRKVWCDIEQHAPEKCHFWSSTSGISASLQNQDMRDPSRLLVVHPFNPPHIMPLIEVVPSPSTNPEEVSFVTTFFHQLKSGHRPVVIKKERPGFVANRLAYILFREAAHLIQEDVLSIEDLDTIVEASLGPRFAVQGPFKSYHLGGGADGIKGFLNNLKYTIQDVWDSYEDVNMSLDGDESSWEGKVIQQTNSTYGTINSAQLKARDLQLFKVLDTQKTDPNRSSDY